MPLHRPARATTSSITPSITPSSRCSITAANILASAPTIPPAGTVARPRQRSTGCLLLAWALVLPSLPAWAQTTVELRSDGGYQSLPLAPEVKEVELVEQTQGACRFNRSWGYDLTNRELWVNGGCGGRFKLVKPEAEESRGSNAAAAAVAVAAIAGIAILANRSHRDRPDDSGPPDPPLGYGQPIRSQRGMCLDVADGRMRPGAVVQLYACHGRENQRFTWGRGGEIVTPNRLCLDIQNANTNDGARLIVWNCSGARNQRWYARGGTIVSQLNGKCVDVFEGQFRNGQAVVAWSCNGGPNQRWWW